MDRSEAEKKQEAAQAVAREIIARDGFGLPILRNKLMITGEGRGGKTSTRKALCGLPFDPIEGSTNGVDEQDVSVVRDKLVNWKVVVEQSPQEKRAYADSVKSLFSSYLSGEISLDQLVQRGVDKRLMDRLLASTEKRKRAVNSKNHRDSRNTPDIRSTGRSGSAPGTSSLTAPPLASSDEGVTPVPRLLPSAGAGAVERVPNTLSQSAVGNQTEDRANDVDLAKILEEYLEETESKQLGLMVWDFGGQRVFLALHHLFLTTQGVYLVVFKATELLFQPGKAVLAPHLS